jgi:hypothetical protein
MQRLYTAIEQNNTASQPGTPSSSPGNTNVVLDEQKAQSDSVAVSINVQPEAASNPPADLTPLLGALNTLNNNINHPQYVRGQFFAPQSQPRNPIQTRILGGLGIGFVFAGILAYAGVWSFSNSDTRQNASSLFLMMGFVMGMANLFSCIAGQGSEDRDRELDLTISRNRI